MTPISAKQLNAFYSIDRFVFRHLITNLSRNPAQSLLVMSLWFWLEKIGYPSIILVVPHLPDLLINALFNEADTCLRWLQLKNASLPDGGALPLTRIAVQMEISLELFIRRRCTAIAGIKSVLNNTCARIFTDILQTQFGSTSARASYASPNINARSSTDASCSTGARARSRASMSTCAHPSTRASLHGPVTPLVVPGFPHPLFGNFTTPPINFGEMDLFDPRRWANTEPHDDVPDDDKTMFLTFSKGFPVTEEEVRHFFTKCYGNCIKVVTMGEKREQVLFATMVLNKVELLDIILRGKLNAKFRVNGKHIWARRYERRD